MSEKSFINNIDSLRIACILDTFSFSVYQYEANFFQLTPEYCQKEIKNFQADLLFVESAWRGKDNLWEGKVNRTSDELKFLLKYCKMNHIPTVFWNKEDPYHFDDFIESAKLFDFVFTTDIESIPLYMECLDHKNIYLLPFACQPKIHNPIEKYERKDAFVFAGAYYHRFSKRNEAFSWMVEALSQLGKVDIYDRNYGNEKTVHKYPEKYLTFIQGGLEYAEIGKAYKGYRYAINLNSITDSPSMFSRRVLELMASNTLVLSNDTLGCHLLLGELVTMAVNSAGLEKKVKKLLSHPDYADKLRLAALRKVMQEHIAADRLLDMASKIYGEKFNSNLPIVACLGYAHNNEELCLIQASYLKQNYKNKKLIIVYDGDEAEIKSNLEDIYCIAKESNDLRKKYFRDTHYISVLDADDYYGSNYILDLVLATRYSDAPIITKGNRFLLNNAGELYHDEESFSYTYISKARLRSSLIDKNEWIEKEFEIESEKNDILTIDPYNYCQDGIVNGLKKEQKIEIDDLINIDTGASFNDVWFQNEYKRLQLNNDKKKEYLELYKKQEKQIGKYKKIQNTIHKLASIKLIRHPVKKFKTYKKLLKL